MRLAGRGLPNGLLLLYFIELYISGLILYNSLKSSALLASITALTAYGHNLKSLIRHTCFCAPDLDKIFPKNTDKEKELFNLLNAAYVDARYSPNYEISQEQVMELLERVNNLLLHTEQSFEERLKMFENLILSHR